MPSASLRRALLPALTLFVSFVFLQSLFFKFTDSPETRHIFGTLDAWAGSLGAPGPFAPHGVFSQYVVGSAELLASLMLLAGLALRRPVMHALGALLALGVISGAIFFHLFTPLGVQVRNADGSLDGGLLFAMACGVWLASLLMLGLQRAELRRLLPGGTAMRLS